MSLTTYFAARSIKKQLREHYTDIELGPVTYTPETKTDDGTTHAASFTAKFEAMNKEDHKKVQGGMTYAPNFDGGAFLSVTGPAA